MKQNDFLKFKEWKQQTKPQFEYECFSDDDSIVRLSDGVIFVKGEIVQVYGYASKYYILEFNPNMIHVEIAIYPYRDKKHFIPVKNLIKQK